MALKEYLQQQYQGRESFLTNVVFPMFGEDLFEDGFNESVLSIKPELAPLAQSSGIESILRIGTINVDFNPIDIYDITVSDKVQMQRNRVSIQMLVRRIMDTYSSSFMIFHYKDNSSWDWRFTFCSKKGNNEDSTDSKRYTFLLGPNQSCRTAAENFEKLIQIEDKGSITVESIISAFDVEALSKEFFGKYKEHYSKFVAYMCDESNGMRNDFIDDSFDKTGLDAAKIKDKEEKPIRDYVKRLLGRIVFLHFLQKKGWMGVPAGKNWGDGDKDFMMSLYEYASESQQANFLDEILEPLFSEALNTDRTFDGDLFDTRVNLSDGSKVRVPYLNGGLFERDKYDEPKTVFPAEYFKDLLEFFYQYNFTIDENDPNDAQVGVDPEMLGRIFENLLEDNKDKGAFYTPKEIVQYMCRQALVAYLQTNEDDTVKSQIENFVTTYDVGEIGGADSDLARTLDQKLKEVKICDPAIGSGAFPMGLLKELFLCRGAIENFDNASDIKKHIIQNNIYGVDIEKGAVDIARLRFWLSLIVDEDTPSALPNLDYKIMQGNSLLESYKGIDLSQLTAEKKEISEGHQLTFFEDESDLQRLNLRNLLDAYYNCPDHKGKTELKKKISDCIQAQLDYSGFSRQGKFGENLIDLSKIDIAGTDQFFLWHTWFSDVFNRPSDCDKSGFDIVIGNPPYLESRSSEFSSSLKDAIQSDIRTRYQGAATAFARGADLLIFFYELSFRLLSKDGYNVFITENSWLSTDYGKKFQEYLLANIDVRGIIDSDYKYFSDAEVNTVITILKNKANRNPLPVSFIHCHGNMKNFPVNLYEKDSVDGVSIKKFSSDDILFDSYKWSVPFNADEEILLILKSLFKYEDATLAGKISIGQGLNLTKDKILYTSDGDTVPYFTSDAGSAYVWQSSSCFLKINNAIIARKRPLLIMPRGIGTHFCCVNECDGYSSSYVEVYANSQLSQSEILKIWLFCNSSLFWLIRELTGRTNLGGGMLKAEATDLKAIPICYDFGQDEVILSIYNRAHNKRISTKIEETLADDVHCQIDNIVNQYLNIADRQEFIKETLKTRILLRKKKSRTK